MSKKGLWYGGSYYQGRALEHLLFASLFPGIYCIRCRMLLQAICDQVETCCNQKLCIFRKCIFLFQFFIMHHTCCTYTAQGGWLCRRGFFSFHKNIVIFPDCRQNPAQYHRCHGACVWHTSWFNATHGAHCGWIVTEKKKKRETKWPRPHIMLLLYVCHSEGTTYLQCTSNYAICLI